MERLADGRQDRAGRSPERDDLDAERKTGGDQEAVLALQRGAGNAAVAQLLARRDDQQGVRLSAAHGATLGRYFPEGQASPRGRTELPYGPEAVLSHTFTLMQTARPVTLTNRGIPVRLRPGEIFEMPGFGDILIVDPHLHEVAFSAGNTLYVQDAASFVDDLTLGALVVGAQRASEWVPISRAVMKFIMAAGPTWAYMAVTGVKFVLWYQAHPDTIDHAIHWGGRLLEARNALRQRYPRLYELVRDEIVDATVENFTLEFSADDIAVLLGTLVGRGMEFAFQTVALTLWNVAKAAVPRLAIVGAGAAAHGTADAMARSAIELVTSMQEAGVTITVEDARRLLVELGDPRALEELEKLQRSFYALSRDLETISRVLSE